MNAEPMETEAEAMALNTLLAQAPDYAPSAALSLKAMAGAPRRRVVGRPRTWLSGMALAAACAAGIVIGVNVSDGVFADPAADSLTQTATAFDGTSYIDTESAG